MVSWKISDYEDIITELNNKGYIRSSEKVLKFVRYTQNENIMRFRPGCMYKGGKSGRYSTLDILGDKFVYCFDMTRKEEFVNFLVQKFFMKNPNPTKGIKNAFTRILHNHRLHWYGCTQSCCKI